jgi:Domain of unknown function (DUF309)
MSKSERITAFMQQLPTHPGSTLDPCYPGFFRCFNSQLYYEAHDVLEQLWLKTRGENYAFFKGLIQVAGAFVHLQKQSLRPMHAKDGRRMHPAARLFGVAASNLEPFGPKHLHLDVAAVCALCRRFSEEIVAGDFQKNPWNPARAPRLELEIEY